MSDNSNNNGMPSFDPNNLNFEELMQQAQKMQDEMKNAQDAILNLKVIGKAGDNDAFATVGMAGDHSVFRTSISEGLMGKDKQIIEETLSAAFNDAVRKLEEETRKKMMEFASSLKLPPGFQMPF